MKKRICVFTLLLLPTLFSACCGTDEAFTTDLKTPQYVVSTPDVNFGKISTDEIHTSSEGIVTILPKGEAFEEANIPDGQDQSIPEPVTPETLWEKDQTVTYNSYTLPEKAMLEEEGCVGVLSIPTISLEMKVYEAEDEMEAMRHGGAHYKETSCWDGNVGISAHVSGVPQEASFANLHKLQKGDSIFYRTALGTRNYTVTEVREICDDDWSWLSRTPDNRITLTTCITGKPDKRLMVQAAEGSPE